MPTHYSAAGGNAGLVPRCVAARHGQCVFRSMGPGLRCGLPTLRSLPRWFLANPKLSGRMPIPITSSGPRRSEGPGTVSGRGPPSLHHRQMIAHGVSRGLNRERDPAPEGRKIPGEWVLSPRWGLGPITDVHPRLTRWATVFRPSGPGATSRGTRGDVGMDAGGVAAILRGLRGFA
jgi:hypothetical protein